MAGKLTAMDNGQEEREEIGDIFCLDDYDCIGFDMDHTIVQYHIEELFKVNDHKMILLH